MDMIIRVYDSGGTSNNLVSVACPGPSKGTGVVVVCTDSKSISHINIDRIEETRPRAKGYHLKSKRDSQYLIGPRDGYDNGTGVRQGFKGTRSMGQERPVPSRS